MQIDFVCDSCGQKYRVDGGLAGRRLKCKKCQAVLTVPEEEEELEVITPEETRPARPVVAARRAPEVEDAYGLNEVYAAPKTEVLDEFEELPSRPGKVRSRAAEMQPASFWQRFCAVFADGLIAGILNLGASFCVGVVIGLLHGPLDEEELQLFQRIWGGLFFLVWTATVATLLSSSGATPGKKAMGIRVVNVRGGPVSFWQAVGRELAKILSGLTLCIGYLIALGGEKRALHDYLAGTRVVKA